MSARILTSIAMVIAAVTLVALGTSNAAADELCANLKGEVCIALNPDTDTNPVGTDHTVTATLTVSDNPIEGTSVAFYIVAGPNAGDSTTQATDASGNAAFTYTGDGGAGTDELIAVACETEFCAEIIGCLDEDIGCLGKVEATCTPEIQAPGRVAAGKNGGGFCFGPANASKTWEDPTATPSPTPIDVGAGGQTPAPSPAELPASGGSAGGGSTPWMLLALVGAAVATSVGGLALARSRAARR